MDTKSLSSWEGGVVGIGQGHSVYRGERHYAPQPELVMTDVKADFHPCSGKMVGKGTAWWRSLKPRRHSATMETKVLPRALWAYGLVTMIADDLPILIMKMAFTICVHGALENDI